VSELLSQALTDAGITFSEEVTSSYRDPSGKFSGSLTFSEALAKAANFSDTEFPDEFMRRVLLDIFGHIAYASLYSIPRYDEFRELVPPAGEQHYFYFGDPRFIALVEPIMDYSGLEVNIGPDYQVYAKRLGRTTVLIRSIHMHFIKMDEFSRLKDAMDKHKILYALVFTDGWAAMSKAQKRGLVVIDNDAIELFGYENGTPGTVDMGFKPMEQSRNASDFKRLHALSEEIIAAEHWFGLLFLSPSHPRIPSILTGIEMDILCLLPLEDLDTARGWGLACETLSEGMFQ